MSPTNMKGLVGHVSCSISGKHDVKYLKLKLDMQLSFKKNRKTMCKELVKQDNKENQFIEHMGNRLYQPEEEKFDEGIGK